MQRVGYDADTQTYTYEDANGCNWEGAAGDRYGTLRRGMFVSSLSLKLHKIRTGIVNKRCSQKRLRAYKYN